MQKYLLILFTFFSVSLHASDENNSEEMPKFKEALYLGVETNGTAIVAVGERGNIALSNDYGETWQQSKNVPTRTTLTAVTMVNKNVWVVGHDTTILHSADSGQTWEVQFIDADRQMPLLDVLFVNESDGYAVGAYGTYITTHDGGKTWEDSLIYEEHDFHLNKIIKVDEFKMFVVAEAGNAYRSYDAGKNWESLELPYAGSMFGAVMFKDQIVSYGLRGNVLVTEDFGDTFTKIDSPVQDSLFGSEHTFSNKLLIIGANGAVLQYKNKSLHKIDIPSVDGDLTEILSIKNNKLVIVSESGISTQQIR